MKFRRVHTCVLLFSLAAAAQPAGHHTALRGEVQGALPHDAQVELRPCQGATAVPLSSSIHATGAFELPAIAPGCYRVSVVAATTGRHFYDSVHDVAGHSGLHIRLPDSKPARPAATGVALGALRPAPSKKAVQLLDQASRLSAQGHFAQAAAKLRQAIAKDPAFAEAHINLGAQLVRLNHQQEALTEFEHARLLGITTAPLHTNIAAALFDLNRFAEAEQALHAALHDDAAYPQAHFLMGQILIRRHPPSALAAEHFRSAVPIPAARIMLAQVLNRLGQRTAAVAELDAYLASGHTAYRAAAQKILQSWR